jgi:hypothetical protein
VSGYVPGLLVYAAAEAAAKAERAIRNAFDAVSGGASDDAARGPRPPQAARRSESTVRRHTAVWFQPQIQAHQNFLGTLIRRQVVEKGRRCGGSIESSSAVRDPFRNKRLLQPLLAVERCLHPQV